jgi:hypothetical protein
MTKHNPQQHAQPKHPKQADQQSHQEALEQALVAQQKYGQQLDRILWYVLPVLAILLSVVFANWNIWSTIGTAFVLCISFVMVGINKKSLTITLAVVLLYCLVDNYLSYGMQFNVGGLKRQLLSMILFISLIGLSRPMFERAMMNRQAK